MVRVLAFVVVQMVVIDEAEDVVEAVLAASVLVVGSYWAQVARLEQIAVSGFQYMLDGLAEPVDVVEEALGREIEVDRGEERLYNEVVV